MDPQDIFLKFKVQIEHEICLKAAVDEIGSCWIRLGVPGASLPWLKDALKSPFKYIMLL